MLKQVSRDQGPGIKGQGSDVSDGTDLVLRDTGAFLRSRLAQGSSRLTIISVVKCTAIIRD